MSRTLSRRFLITKRPVARPLRAHARTLATASHVFDGFAERTEDCLIDLSPGADYTKYTISIPC